MRGYNERAVKLGREAFAVTANKDVLPNPSSHGLSMAAGKREHDSFWHGYNDAKAKHVPAEPVEAKPKTEKPKRASKPRGTAAKTAGKKPAVKKAKT